MDTRKPIKTDTRKITDAESYHKSFTERLPDLLTYQKEFNFGQARINFELNAVDQNFVDALKLILAALEKLKEIPQLTQQLEACNLTAICEKLNEAEKRCKTVADIRPPGCQGPYPA